MVLSGRAVPRSEPSKKYLEISDRLAAFTNVKTTAESTEQIKFYQNNNERQTQGTMQYIWRFLPQNTGRWISNYIVRESWRCIRTKVDGNDRTTNDLVIIFNKDCPWDCSDWTRIRLIMFCRSILCPFFPSTAQSSL